MILGCLNLRFKQFEELDITEELEYASLYDIFTDTKNSEAILWVMTNGIYYPVYLNEVRPDYVNKVIYLPIYKYDLLECDGCSYSYNHRIEKCIIHSFKDGLILENDLVIQQSLLSSKAYKIKLSNLILGEPQCKSADELWQRYLRYCYGYGPYDCDNFKYTVASKSLASRYHKKCLNEHNLEFYGEFLDTDYRDVREYKLIDLQKRFTDEELGLEMPYEIRRLQFEFELYTGLYTKTYWSGWTIGDINQLSYDNRDYVKYKKKGIYLIFKKRWL